MKKEEIEKIIEEREIKKFQYRMKWIESSVVLIGIFIITEMAFGLHCKTPINGNQCFDYSFDPNIGFEYFLYGTIFSLVAVTIIYLIWVEPEEDSSETS